MQASHTPKSVSARFRPHRWALSLLLLLLTASVPLTAQEISCREARQRDEGEVVTLRGLVTNGPELDRIRYFQDSTGGFAAYDGDYESELYTQVETGDSILIRGEIGSFNELQQLSPVYEVTVLSSGHPNPAPQRAYPGELDEPQEGLLLRMENLVFEDGGSLFSPNRSYRLFGKDSQGEDADVILYVRTDHPLVGLPIPADTVNITGIGSQFRDNYQILPRGPRDIERSNSIWIQEPLQESNITRSSFNLQWATNLAGDNSWVEYGLSPALERGRLDATTLDTVHSLQVGGLQPAQLVYARAFSVNSGDTARTPLRTFITQSNSSGAIRVLFNTPFDSSVATRRTPEYIERALDDTLIAFINRARETIDLAIYNMNNFQLSNMSNALEAAHNRGVRVRIIHDACATNSAVTRDLDPAVPRLVRQNEEPECRDGIMHNKFMVIDAEADDPNQPLVWTGSTNFTRDQVNIDDNDVIIIQDQSLARAYTVEFEEMWGGSEAQPNPDEARFGDRKRNNTPHEFVIGGRRVQSYFSPSDNTGNRILETLQSADHEIHLSVMDFTRSEIANAIVDRYEAGVAFEGLVNDTAGSGASQNVVNILSRRVGDRIRIDCPNTILHHKYVIVDANHTDSDPRVLTGSHNWSGRANSINDENTLIIHDATIANMFYQRFRAAYDEITNNFDENCEPVVGREDRQVLAPGSLRLMPNPARGTFTLEVETLEAGTAVLTMTDLTGRIVLQQTRPTTPGLLRLRLAPALPPGLYFVGLNLGQTRLSQKLIWQGTN